MTAPTDNTTQGRRTPPVVAAAPLVAPVPGVGLVGHAQALQSILSDVSTLTISQLVQLFRQYGDQPDFPATLYAAFPEIVRPHAQAAAQITAQWFDELHPLSARQAEPVVDLPAERISGTIDWALNAPTKARVVEAPAPTEVPTEIPAPTEIPTEAPAPPETPTESPNTKPDPQTVLDRLSGSAQRMVFDASRATVHANSGTKTKFARYASANACAFCQVMATRGPVYNSDRSATRVVGRYGHARGTQPLGERWHDRCRCIAVPVPGGETYTPPDYVGDWEAAYLAARDKGHTSLKAILSHMRAHTDAR